MNSRNKVKRYIWNWLILIDQAINVFFGGDPDETMSSRMGKRSREQCPFCYWVCRWLNIFQKDHCQHAVERDRGSRDVIK